MKLRAVDSWTEAKSPTELVAAALPSAARVTGAIADAVVRIDEGEHARRAELGLAAGVEDLDLLDALMCLPLNHAVSVDDLEVVELAHLRACPPGCVQWIDDGSRVLRRLAPATTIELVVVHAQRWRSGLRRAAAFEPFAVRVVVIDRPRHSLVDVAWEADVTGVGLWVRTQGGEIIEVVTPTPFVRRYVKPAAWRFSERAYTTWLNATTLSSPPGGLAGRPARSTPAASHQPLPGF